MSLRLSLQRLPHPVVPPDGIETITSSVSEALRFLGREPDGQASPALKQWRELFCVKNQRLYYVNDEVGYNSWHAPPYFQFREWSLDSQLYGIPICLARDIYQTLDAFLTRHAAEVVFRPLQTLAKIVGNVADCGNDVERYRALRVDNARFREAVWDVPGAAQILFVVGFKRQGELLSVAADAPLGPLQAAASRLRRLADRKGHSGEATPVNPDGGDGGRPPSSFYDAPGFRYQEQIWHCSVCDHAINDGSERLWTGKHDAPVGEYRFRCSTCEDAGATFDLCQPCWDRFQEQEAAATAGAAGAAGAASSSSSGGGGGGSGGALLHDPRHAFQHIGPRMSRHNDYYGNRGAGGDAANPWGNNRAAQGSFGRALKRLGDRYGIRNWG